MFFDEMQGLFQVLIYPIFNIQLPLGFSFGIYVCGVAGVLLLFRYIRGIN